MPDRDIEGNPRPNPPGSNPDMGAYENPFGELTGSIKGRVTDPSGNPLPRTFVIAVDAETKEKIITLTAVDGYYEIPNVPVGTYWVICIKKAYKPGIRKVEVTCGDAIIVDFKLKPKLE